MPIIQAPKNDFSDISSEATAPYRFLSTKWGEELAMQQLELEHEAYTEGEKRFIKTMERQIQAGEFADNTTAKPLISTLVPKVALRLAEWMAEKGAKGGHRPVAWVKLQGIEPEVAAVITVKMVLTCLAKDPNVNITKAAHSVGRAVEDERRFGRIRDEEAKLFNSTIKSRLDKRVGHLYKKAFMHAVESELLRENTLSNAWESWRNEEIVHVGVRLIEALIESTGLVTVTRKFAGNARKDGEYIELAPEYVELLSRRAGALAGISPMLQPCVVPPKPWTSPLKGGYWAAGRKPFPLIRAGSKDVPKRYKDVYMPNVYEAVNTIQDTAWKVNTKVLDVVNEIINWKNCPVSDVPPMDAQRPEPPAEHVVNDAVLFKAWKRSAAVIYRREKARVSKRLSMEFIVEQANKFNKFDKIWFPMNLDWRGRVYAIPMFNPQGSDMTKGLLTLAEGKPIGEDGFYWLRIHGANCAGMDKVTFPERIEWVENNKEHILASAMDPLGYTWWASLDSPFCFLAFCFEYAEVINKGLSYICSLPLAFDGSCSGIQHFSAMLRDEVGGKAVNLLPSNEVQDIYRIVAERVTETLKEDVVNGTPDTLEVVTRDGEMVEKVTLGTAKLAAQWLEYGVTRSITKRSVMTLPYGSKEYGFRDQVLEDTIRPAVDDGTGNMFTQPHQAAGYMAKLIWQAVSVTVVAAVEAMSWLQQAAALLSAEVKDSKTKEVLRKPCAVHWTTPDGFPVWQEYRKPIQKRLNLIFMGEFRLQPTINTKEFSGIDRYKQRSGIAPNFVHSQDGSHLRMTIVHASRAYGIKSFAVIHDSFGTIPADAGDLFKAVRESMVKTYADNDVLADFYEQFECQLHESQIAKMPPLPKKGNLDIYKILESDFAFA